VSQDLDHLMQKMGQPMSEEGAQVIMFDRSAPIAPMGDALPGDYTMDPNGEVTEPTAPVVVAPAPARAPSSFWKTWRGGFVIGAGVIGGAWLLFGRSKKPTPTVRGGRVPRLADPLVRALQLGDVEGGHAVDLGGRRSCKKPKSKRS
jgi:hypothetical protein